MEDGTVGSMAPGKSKIDVRTIAEVGIAVALAAVLNLLPAFELPQGGSISLDMVPIMFLALRRGWKVGVLTGVAYGFVDLAMKPYIVHPAQLVLDYPLAFGLVGLAGVFKPDNVAKVAAGCLLGGAGRFAAHVASGVIFFASYAPKGQNVLVYSIVYNGLYMLPSTLIAIPIVYGLLAAMTKAEGGQPLTR